FMGLAMAGCNIIHVAIGNLEMMRLASFEACLIANEMLGATFRFLQGMDCSRDAIGVDAFREVKHQSRFIGTMHSLKYSISDERWSPKLTDRNSWENWMIQSKGKDMAQRANEQAKRILKEYHPVYVNEKEAKEIDKIAREAQNFFIRKLSRG
ncbi:MAG: trimethylamine methyltransferase family protein, partial [Bacteroidales bacterium]|nr:trimethylamine methyltransferase family protein [Bacteroidales bacterium]